MDIANRIRTQREKLGLSVDELAIKCGLSRGSLYRYENGASITCDALSTIAKSLGCTPAYLIGYEEADINAIAAEIASQSSKSASIESELKKNWSQFAHQAGFPADGLAQLVQYYSNTDASTIRADAALIQDVHSLSPDARESITKIVKQLSMSKRWGI